MKPLPNTAMPSALALMALLSLGLFGCPNTHLVNGRPSIEEAEEQMTSCKVAKDPLNPMIIEWPAINRTQLQSKSAEGVVIVSYVGCHLKILTGCDASGSYEFRGTQPAGDKVRMANESELNAKLPLGFVDLKGKLAHGNSLELDYVAVGERVSSKAPAALSGSCQGATHYVRAMTMGAFSLDTVARGEVSGEVSVGEIGAGGGQKEERANVNHSGDVKECSRHRGSMSESEAEESECGAILQLSLQPLKQVGSGGVVSAGFGANIGPMGDVPTVSDSNIRITQTSLKDVDVTFLNLLQDAKRADKDETLSPQSKADKWAALCGYEGKNPIREEVCRRRNEWQEVAEAQRKRQQQIDELRSQYQSDKAKLDQLLAMDNDIVSPEQKHAYKEEFDQVYTPYKDIIDSAPASSSASSASSAGTGDVPVSENALAKNIVAIDIGGGFGFNGLVKDADKEKMLGSTSIILGPKQKEGGNSGTDGEGGGFFRARVALQVTEGVFVDGIFRYGFNPDWKPLFAGGGVGFRGAIDSVVPQLGMEVGYFNATGLQFSGPTGGADASIHGAGIELYAGASYLMIPFLSIGVMAGVQGLILSRSPITDTTALANLCGTDTTNSATATCSANLQSDASTSGIMAYLEANMAFHF